jgi:hypothetical protein
MVRMSLEIILIERESIHDESLEELSIIISLVHVILDVRLP